MEDAQYLFCVANLMRSNHFKPPIGVQHADKRVRPEVGGKIACGCFVQKRESAFANSTQIRKHGFFGVEEIGIERNGRLAADDGGLDDLQRKMKTLEESNRSGRMAGYAVGGT